jgi:uncharacterized protein YacL (UPF0231 family)
MKFDEFTEEYNDRIDDLNDAKLMIRELKMKLREKNLENSNISLFITEDEISIATFKKLSDSLVFIDDKNSIIDD